MIHALFKHIMHCQYVTIWVTDVMGLHITLEQGQRHLNEALENQSSLLGLQQFIRMSTERCWCWKKQKIVLLYWWDSISSVASPQIQSAMQIFICLWTVKTISKEIILFLGSVYKDCQIFFWYSSLIGVIYIEVQYFQVQVLSSVILCPISYL